MATYCIGDIQGCHDEFLALLERLEFDPDSDRLWLTGDLVNRGPRSLAVMRYVRDLGDCATVILGNHDIHMLAAWSGASDLKKNDTVQHVLDAPDADELMHWLRRQPLLHEDPELGYVMLHAGLLPAWTLEQARDRAREAEAALGGEDFRELFDNIYGDTPDNWSDELTGWDRLRCIINAFTRMRFCDVQGRMRMDYKGPPGGQPDGLVPWFEVPGRKPMPAGQTLVVGHWSTLGYHEQEGLVALDTGCLWGGCLTAIRLDGERRRISQPCPGAKRPG